MLVHHWRQNGPLTSHCHDALTSDWAFVHRFWFFFKSFCCDVNRWYSDGTHFCTHFCSLSANLSNCAAAARYCTKVIGQMTVWMRLSGLITLSISAIYRDGCLLSVLGSFDGFSAQWARFFLADFVSRDMSMRGIPRGWRMRMVFHMELRHGFVFQDSEYDRLPELLFLKTAAC